MKEQPLIRITLLLRATILSLTITITACDSPPTTNVDTAKTAVNKTTTDRADQYTAESLKATHDAQSTLDLKMKAQEDKQMKSYSRTKELAATAKATDDKTAANTATTKEKTDTTAKIKAAATARRAKAITTPIRIDKQIKPPTKIKNVTPIYPAIARSAHIAEAVVIAATIDKENKVVDAKIIHSIPLLDQAALDAVQQ